MEEEPEAESETTVEEAKVESETVVEETEEEPETAADEEPEKEEDAEEESTIDESQEQETELNEEAEASVEETYTQNGWDEWGSYYENGIKAKSDWRKIGGYWYWFDSYGYKVTDNNNYYYVTKDDAYYAFDAQGHMRKGWVQDNDGNWYYFDKNGKGIHTQWMKSGKYWYYLYDDGMVVSGYIYYYVAQNNAKYSFDESGHMRKGWVQGNNGEWYYFGKDGKMLVNQWMQLGDNLYYFIYNGQMATGYCVINGELHYFNNGGIWQRQLS